MIVALTISTIFIVCQFLIIKTAIFIYAPESNIAPHVVTYFNILIWGAPFVLIGYVNLGWLMGRKLVKETLLLQISMNVLNIILDILFVLVLQMDVKGVAWATLISQIYGFALGLFFIRRNIEVYKITQYIDNLLNHAALKKIMSVNSALMIRTVCLLIMTNMFVAKGSDLGTNFLAANAILFQLQYIIAYFFEGLANATSVFTGKSVGRNDLHEFIIIERISIFHAIAVSVAMSIIIFIFKGSIIPVFTDLDNIITLCNEYIDWLIIFPYTIGFALVYYGVFIGATYTAPIRNSSLIALLVFIVSYYTVIPIYQNHGLWLAFILFSASRSVFLYMYRKTLIRDLFTTEKYTQAMALRRLN